MKVLFIPLRHLAGALAIAVSALTAGCGSIIPPAAADPTRFYILSGNPSADAPVAAKQIGLRPVELPGYLRNTRSLVTKAGDHEVRFVDYHRWAEPLDAAIGRLLRERLTSRVSPGGVYAPPFPGDVARDVDVFVRVIRCEGEPSTHQSVFVATYSITPAPGKEGMPITKRYEAPAQAWDGADYAALARSLSLSIEGLADQIAADLP